MTSEPSRSKPESSHSQEVFHFRPEWRRTTLGSIGDAVITTDPEGRVTFLNPLAESLTGWTQQEAAGVLLESVFKIVNQETHQTVESPTVRALREGVVVGLANHTLLIAKDGTERPIDDSAAPILNDQGEITGIVLAFRDVTERRRQEQHIQDALTYADNIIATMRGPFAVLDKSLRIKTANRAFYQNFHVSPEETEGRCIYELGNGQWNIPRLRMLLEEVLSNSHPIHDYEVEHDFPAIGKKIMLLNASRFESVDSQPNLILLAIEDITERKQAEATVQSSEVRYRRLFETARDGILILDASTVKIIDSNPYMTELLGYTHDEFLGKELWEIGLFGDEKASQAAYRQLQQNGYIRYDYLPLKTKHGKKAEVEFVSNVYQVDGRHVAQCNIRDISERSRLERKTKEQAEALADLHLRKDEFLAMLSHELRNPLAPISDAVQVLRLQKNEDQVQQQARTIIERQVWQLNHLIDDLLEVSRITTGRIHLNEEQVAVSSIVEHAVETVRPLIKQRRHTLEVSLPPQPIWLHADATRLEQVIVNLLTNAAKYTNQDGQIWLSVVQEAGEAVLRIRDTGVGIAPELLPHVFDLFTQAERSLDRSQGGLGIGLCLVKRLVEMHGGRVEAHSVLDQGSEFVVRLPVTPAVLPPATPQKTADPNGGHPLRVLVVDDNVDAATALSMRLEMAGHEVRTVYDGPATLATALDYRPEVVLLDIGLPGMSGLEVAKQLRQQSAFEKVMLVAMTGYGQKADRQRSLEAGFDHHLVKPADFGKLQNILATVSEKAT